MQGNAKVEARLQAELANELAARHQYEAHSAMYGNWGYKRLAKIAKRLADEEGGHANELMERLTFFNQVPNVSVLGPVNVKSTVPEMIASDFSAETKAIDDYGSDYALSIVAGDVVTAINYFAEHAKDESEHASLWEAELQMIKDVGLQNYLAEQMRE